MDSRLETAQRRLIIVLVFFVVLAVYPSTPDPTGDIKILGYEIGSFAALALWLFTPRSGREPGRYSPALFYLILLYSGLNLAACFFSVNVGYSITEEFIKLAALTILFVVVSDVFSAPRHVWTLFTAICLAVSIASVYGFIQYRGWDPLPWDRSFDSLRGAPSTFGNRNFASHVLAPACILGCGLCSRKKTRWVFFSLCFFAGHFMLTRTRGSLAALAAALVLILVAFAVSRYVKRPGRAVAITLGVFTAVAVLGVVAIGAVIKMKTGQIHPEDTSVRLRYHSFDEACRMVQDKPWLGHGLGMYQVASPPYWTPLDKIRFTAMRRVSDHVHNEPLEIAAETGLPSSLAYVSIFVLGIYCGLSMAFGSADAERRKLGFTFAAFFLAFLLDGFFGFNVHVPASAALLFIVSGAAVGVWRERPPLPAPPARRYGRSQWSWRVLAIVSAATIPIVGIANYSAQLWHQRGLDAAHFAAYAPAADYFRKAKMLQPFDWNHWYKLGEMAMLRDKPEEAEAYFAQTLRLNPGYIVAQFMVARAAFNTIPQPLPAALPPSLGRAIAYARRAAEIDPQFPQVQDLLGRASFLRATWLANFSGESKSEETVKAWQEAEQHLLLAIDYGCNDKDQLYRLIALGRMARNDALGAEEALASALEQKPDATATWGLFEQLSQKAGRYDAIRASLDRYIQSPRNSAVSADELVALELMRANVLHTGYHDDSGARDAFLRVVRRNPANVEAWAAYHAVAKAAEKEQSFEEDLRQVVCSGDKVDPKLPPILQAVAAGLLSKNEEGVLRGVATLTGALQRVQSTTPGAEGTARQFSWAADVLCGQAVRAPLSPANAGRIFLDLGAIYGACGDFDAAVNLLERAAPHLTGDGLLQCLLREGDAYTRLGKSKLALKAFEEAAQRAPTSFEAGYGAAKAFAQDGQWARARLEYSALLNRFAVSDETRSTIERELGALPK